MATIFVRTAHTYDSYSDFWSLVELSEFPICTTYDIDFQSNDTYITTPLNGELRVDLRAECLARKCTLIAWSLERNPDQIGKDLGLVDYLFVSDRHYQQLIGDERVKYLTLGSHPGLGSLSNGEKVFDFIHLSYVIPRRNTIYNFELQDLVQAPNSWGEERHKNLLSSRLMLNVHQDEIPILEPLRFALCAAYGLPLITEEVVDSYPFEPGRHIIPTPYDQISQTVRQVLNNLNDYREIGINLHYKLTQEITFRSSVELAISKLRSI